jgi:tRNA-dihydrouridine synthase C
VADPGLALAIRGGGQHAGLAWGTLLPLIAQFWELVCSRLDAHARAGRLKQWLNFLRRRYPEAELAFQALRTVNQPAAISRWLAEQGFEAGVGFEAPVAVAQARGAGQGLLAH